MSDTQQGPGWWQASDGRWYPPEQHPNHAPPPPPSGVQGYAQPPAAAQTWQQPTATITATVEPAKKKRNGCVTAFAVVFGLLVLLGIAGALLGGGDGDEQADADPATTTAEEPASTEPAAEPGTRENPLPAGQAHDIGDGWSVKVAGYNPNGNELVAAANMFNEPAAPGSQYVVVQVDATNTGEETRTTFDLTFELLGSAGVTIPLSASFCVAPEPSWAGLGEAYPDATLSGFLCAQVPSDQVGSLVLIAEPTLALSGNKTFLALA